MTDVAMIETTINGRWSLKLPEHRAMRPDWVTGWEPERVASIAANLLPGDVLYDIGTEEGDLSALYASFVHNHDWRGTGGVVLIEPNPRVWPNIRAIFEGNDIPAPLATFAGFAASEDQTPDALATSGWPGCAFGPLIGDHGFLNLSERPEVPRIQIDTIAVTLDSPPDAITIDVEGAELHVLRGARKVLDDTRPLVWVSVHPEFMFTMYDQYERDLHDYMHEHRYRAAHLGYDHEHHVLFYPTERRGQLDLSNTSECR